MMMEIYLDEEKCKKNNINVDWCYDQIKEYLEKYDIYEVKRGVYYGKDNSHCFTGFGILTTKLPRTDWFMNVVDQWYWRVESNDIKDREDCLDNCYMNYLLSEPKIDSLYEN